MSFHLKTFPNQPYTFTPSKAKDSFIFDNNGKRYLDLTAGGTSFSLIGSEIKEYKMQLLNSFLNLNI